MKGCRNRGWKVSKFFYLWGGAFGDFDVISELTGKVRRPQNLEWMGEGYYDFINELADIMRGFQNLERGRGNRSNQNFPKSLSR